MRESLRNRYKYEAERLLVGETVIFQPKGDSMSGKIESGQEVRLRPLKENESQEGDIALCKLRKLRMLHLVVAREEDKYIIGNNRGEINGTIDRGAIFGKAIFVAGKAL